MQLDELLLVGLAFLRGDSSFTLEFPQDGERFLVPDIVHVLTLF